jgi:beta-lactamase regulating signal transducer with metallopeptidase domain
VIAGLAALVASGSMPADPLESCKTLAATAAVRLTSVGILLPAGLLGAVLLSGGLALAHQVWTTRQVLGRVLSRRTAPDSRLARIAAEAGIAGRIDLIDDSACYTFCHGLAVPRICLSTGLVALLSDGELRAVLLHEAHHVAHRDPVKILSSRTLASALFFLPLAGALRNGFLAGKEISADAAAGTHGDAAALATALVKMLRADRPVWPAGVLAIGALSPTETRIRHLIEPEAGWPTLPSPTEWIVSAALVAGIFGFSYGSAAARTDASLDTFCGTAVAWADTQATAPPAPPGAAR